jgi:hypothetical protein
MRAPDTHQLAAMLEARGYPLYGPTPYDLTLVGLRRDGGTTDAWDDAVGALYHDDQGILRSEFWVATTDPGRPWLENPSRPEGCAILVPGHYRRCWTIGEHRGVYQALVQRGDMLFYRDGNRDDVVDPDGDTECGLIGCNLHRASARQLVDEVGLYSAGCQVIRDVRDFERLLHLCSLQVQRGLGHWFSYTLMTWRP